MSQPLTPAMERIFSLLSAGESMKTAAATLGLSHKTVQNHVQAAYARLGVRSINAALAWYHARQISELQAENERLTEAYVDGKMREDRDSLLAQVERLTKAGDAMAFELEPSLKYNPSSEDIRYQVRLWLAAKEVQP